MKWRRIEAELALIEQTPDGLIWLGNGGNMTALRPGQLRTLQAMLRDAQPGPAQLRAMRIEDADGPLYVVDDPDAKPRPPRPRIPPLTPEETGPLR